VDIHVEWNSAGIDQVWPTDAHGGRFTKAVKEFVSLEKLTTLGVYKLSQVTWAPKERLWVSWDQRSGFRVDKELGVDTSI
jgi:hypothetical protein